MEKTKQANTIAIAKALQKAPAHKSILALNAYFSSLLIDRFINAKSQGDKGLLYLSDSISEFCSVIWDYSEKKDEEKIMQAKTEMCLATQELSLLDEERLSSSLLLQKARFLAEGIYLPCMQAEEKKALEICRKHSKELKVLKKEKVILALYLIYLQKVFSTLETEQASPKKLLSIYRALSIFPLEEAPFALNFFQSKFGAYLDRSLSSLKAL